MTEKELTKGRTVQHFKRELMSAEEREHSRKYVYEIIGTAIHTETGERLVIYRAMYGEHETFVRPVDMFLSKVDRELYPDVKQIYRFEPIEGEPRDLSDRQFRIFRNIHKTPKMYMQNPSMSALSAFELGFHFGWGVGREKNEASSLFDVFLDELCEKYSISSPWYSELIDRCGSDERAFEVFMEEMEAFAEEHGIKFKD